MVGMEVFCVMGACTPWASVLGLYVNVRAGGHLDFVCLRVYACVCACVGAYTS